jgi:hypothetical protein
MNNIRPISLDEMDRLGIDDHHRLYWKGEPLVTKNEIALSGWLNFAVVLGALAAFVTAVVDLLEYLKI